MHLWESAADRAVWCDAHRRTLKLVTHADAEATCPVCLNRLAASLRDRARKLEHRAALLRSERGEDYGRGL